MALRVFEEDKIAYVFESSSRVSGAMASQIKTQLDGVLGISKPIFQDYLNEAKFSAVSQVIFSSEHSLEAVFVFTPDKQGLTVMTAHLEKTQGQAESVMKEVKDILPVYFKELAGRSRLVRIPGNNDRVFIFEKVVDEANLRTTIFLIVVRMAETAELFRTASSQQVLLLAQDGTVLLGPENIAGKKIQTMVTPSFLKGISASVSQGAETLRATDGTDSLVSFSKVGFGDLTVVTRVDKNRALGAIQILIRKSLILFVFLISLTVIIGLFASNGITQALTQLFEATQKVSEGDFNIQVDVTSKDEVGVLADNFNSMAAEVSRLLEQTTEKARMESELQTAKTVQDTLFPETPVIIKNLAIAGYYEPASECGGDWWHYCEVGSKIFLWIGDATGHGAPAALITSAARSASAIIERLNVSPSGALELLNRSIFDVSRGQILMTFFLASFDKDSGELVYCNASHEAPLVIRKRESEPIKNDLEFLNQVNNPRLGQARDSVYKEASIHLGVGDSVFFYTDGIADIQNPGRVAWGERKFIKALLDANKDYPEVATLVERFSGKFMDHRQSTPLIDDVTFFVIKYENPHPSRSGMG